MTDRDLRRWARYLRLLADLMGLRDWTVNLMAGPTDDEDHAAQVKCVYGRRIANVWLAADWATYDPESQRHVLVHELIHVPYDQGFTFLLNALPDLVGRATWSALEAGYRQHHELATDHLADVLAQHMPLP